VSVLRHNWKWMERPASDLPREITKLLADTETRVLGGQVHEATMLRPILLAIGGLVGMVAVTYYVHDTSDPRNQVIRYAAIVGFLALVVNLIWQGFEWTRNLIFITGYRIIYTRGIITRRVAMLPISKVTDMSYNRSPAGMLFRYGEFIIESAGQDQALREINFVPDPDATYRHLQNLLFKKVPQDVSVVNITTKKRLPVSWSGRLRNDPNGAGGRVEQDDDTVDF
jgi:membrane protein YdbS with pleckstrin-like domain